LIIELNIIHSIYLEKKKFHMIVILQFQCSRRLTNGSCQLPIVVLHVNIPPSIDPNVPTLLTLGKNTKKIFKYKYIFYFKV